MSVPEARGVGPDVARRGERHVDGVACDDLRGERFDLGAVEADGLPEGDGAGADGVQSFRRPASIPPPEARTSAGGEGVVGFDAFAVGVRVGPDASDKLRVTLADLVALPRAGVEDDARRVGSRWCGTRALDTA